MIKDKDESLKVSKSYVDILRNLKSKIMLAQQRAMGAVNRELIIVYRDVGKTIYDQQKIGDWGDSIVKTLARDLQKSFPGIRGFSYRNLYAMKELYLAYKNNEKLQTLSAQISWSHNVIILSKCKDDIQKEFYMKMTKANSWSYRVLRHKIELESFEKTMCAQTNFKSSLPSNMLAEAALVVKDEYALDFLDLSDKHSEYELEKAIIKNIEGFLREVGASLAFLGSQYRLEVEGQEFFIDLLFYNRNIKSLIAIELKVSEFIPEYIGKMQFYLAVLDDKVRVSGENPSIGIILCKSKKRTVVEYALKDVNKPISVSSYHLVKELPQELRKELPSLKQMEKLLENI
ncbi:MAG: putative nuclease YhcG [Chlamydiia bacterium]|nr:putative nuclease YhcG [Chlamydiia bacterium]MCH9618740.1 putative nuclease YhcG [Chlamydiia bacterium]MCH9624520.1 putative nuclease YhcG [Chlamydiia bacterium]